jgi:hypothetical protein
LCARSSSTVEAGAAVFPLPEPLRQAIDHNRRATVTVTAIAIAIVQTTLGNLFDNWYLSDIIFCVAVKGDRRPALPARNLPIIHPNATAKPYPSPGRQLCRFVAIPTVVLRLPFLLAFGVRRQTGG